MFLNLKFTDLTIGMVLWWSHSDQRCEWSCPVVITKVKPRKKEFWFLDLSDMTSTAPRSPVVSIRLVRCVNAVSTRSLDTYSSGLMS